MWLSAAFIVHAAFVREMGVRGTHPYKKVAPSFMPENQAVSVAHV